MDHQLKNKGVFAKGFTLLELIIVIGIIAILGTVSVLVLNPAQLFAQARDTTRISDLASVSSAIGLYLSSVSSPNLGASSFTCGTNFGSSYSGATGKFLTAVGAEAHGGVASTTGTGWVAVDFTQITGGSPLSVLPKDPTNSATYNYQYSCNSTNQTYELDAKMESTRYSQGGSDDKESTDGGDVANEYETGSSLTL
ncbi:prepilin-type N-terminal cleavage/methylation domain-containing protein [Patescibacteria group bacterium]|nr:prepilin-type N-terminal cleavage/methylation domain-containing protein [Patescibacteria group bacterium]